MLSGCLSPRNTSINVAYYAQWVVVWLSVGYFSFPSGTLRVPLQAQESQSAVNAGGHVFWALLYPVVRVKRGIRKPFFSTN